MIIEKVPVALQPKYKSTYPIYSCGYNLEEIYYHYFLKHKDKIQIDRIYLPVFWTSYYIINGYGERISESYKWLNQLDKNKKYFTVVQYASGIYIPPEYDLDIIVFTAGGGGLNKKSDCTHIEKFYGYTQHIFHGKRGDIVIPLMCLPLFPSVDCKKDIFCSFMGRYNTHKCRCVMREILQTNPKYQFYDVKGYDEYRSIVNRSVFTLAPRGFGYTSFRLYEAILVESIPIYIWEDKKVLPFEDEIDWSSFSIVIHTSEIEKLPEMLKKVNVEEYVNNMRKIKSLFHIEETFQRIFSSPIISET